MPRKANEIALDELLKESLSTRNTNNYRKILKAVFDQSILRKDDVAYDFHNCKVSLKHVNTYNDVLKTNCFCFFSLATRLV